MAGRPVHSFGTRAVLGAWLCAILLIAEPAAGVSRTVVQQRKLIGGDKLKGKFGGKGLLLAAPLAGGRFGGAGVLGQSTVSEGSVLSTVIDNQVDGIFGGLLGASPFAFDAGAKKKGVFAKGPLKKKKPLKKKGVKGGLTSKLGLLQGALGVGAQGPSVLGQAVGVGTEGAARAGNAVDGAIGMVQTSTRGGLDLGLALLDANPETANLKNTIFRTMLFGLYVDSSLNARKSVLELFVRRLNGYKRILKPLGAAQLIDPVAGAFLQSIEAISSLLSLPRSIFRASAVEGEAPAGFFEGSFRNVRETLQRFNTNANDFRQSNALNIFDLLRRAERSAVVGVTDDGISWVDRFRQDTRSDIDSRTLEAERLLNDWVNAPNQAINGAIQNMIDTVGDGASDSVVLNQWRGLGERTNGQFDDIRRSISDGLGFLQNSQNVVTDEIASRTSDLLDQVTGGSLEDLRPSGRLDGLLDAPLAASERAGNQFRDVLEAAAGTLDGTVLSASQEFLDPELRGFIQQSVQDLDPKVVDLLNLAPTDSDSEG
ncbi:hypothetical protein BSKO_03434 [Bryopsis sp. KO-2023]|nr:hypothetical protein BSKO_03434 [Bryopsis sp. KO-2023]